MKKVAFLMVILAILLIGCDGGGGGGGDDPTIPPIIDPVDPIDPPPEEPTNTAPTLYDTSVSYEWPYITPTFNTRQKFLLDVCDDSSTTFKVTIKVYDYDWYWVDTVIYDEKYCVLPYEHESQWCCLSFADDPLSRSISAVVYFYYVVGTYHFDVSVQDEEGLESNNLWFDETYGD